MPDHLGPYKLNSIVTGDARILAGEIPDESVDLIFTDPPYHHAFIPLFGDLAKIAVRVLKPGRFLLTLSGAAYLDRIIPLMSEHLDYYWLGGMPHDMGCVAKFHPRQMMDACKPVLWYSNGSPIKHDYIFDYFRGKRDKNHHEWGQPVNWFVYNLRKLSSVGDIILDPCAGSGTILVACKILNRQYLAFEIDPDTADLARQRVANIQPPLFVPQPKQITLEI